MDEPNLILHLISGASTVVKIVLFILFLCSIFAWFWICQRFVVIKRNSWALTSFEQTFWSGSDLQTSYLNIEKTGNFVGINNVFFDGFREFLKLRSKQVSPVATMEGVQRAMRVSINREEEVLSRGLSTLASIGSVSPYIGLFGTVWGIMNSFIGLAASTEAVTINTVAPGIAEALIATAMGLLAAIPSVLAYNFFVNKSEMLLSRYDVFAEEFSSILHRRLFSRTNS